jgi:hypothetical protein
MGIKEFENPGFLILLSGSWKKKKSQREPGKVKGCL